jgi:hypothetical protein
MRHRKKHGQSPRAGDQPWRGEGTSIGGSMGQRRAGSVTWLGWLGSDLAPIFF